ncbi:MAG: adenylate/guanylate cyclase domain-containing protein [Proteobacteria bacterium]|nr:adenylate/guanylate cyclase domain-containing protein [Pseudomonadota bacterium]
MERRLAAILAADVVGYTRLMGADEAGTLARLKALRGEVIDPEIAAHNGRLVKLMGDGALVEFASVVDAVACAVAIQREMAARDEDMPEDRRITFRIGINLGDVIVDGDDIYGDGVNIAARLEGLAEPGGICVSRTVFNHVKGKVDFGFDDLGEQEVKNIPEPVRIFKVLLDAPAAEHTAAPAPAAKRSVRWPLTAAGLVALVIVAGLALWQRPWEPREEPASVEAMAFPLPDRPSIAVLPFINMSDDPNQDYFADGMTEDLITDLSKLSGLFVIARNSSFSYKGQQVKVRQVAEELGVRYVLEGSVRRAGDQVRINAQLIDATTGGHLWAERYDGTLDDVFALQDRVTRKIVAALAVQLTAGEQERVARKETDNAEAYDAFLQGWQHYLRQNPENFRKAISYFEKAVELDPQYARAYAALAATYAQVWKRYWHAKVGLRYLHDPRFLAEEFLEQALLDPTPLAHQVAAGMLSQQGRHEEAIAEAERAISLDPNDADGYIALASALSLAGRPEEAHRLVQRAMRLNPHYPPSYLYELGITEFSMERFEKAVESLERASALNPDDRWSLRLLLATYGLLGRKEEAAGLLETAGMSWRGIDPLTVRGVAFWYPFKEPADAERLAEGLRRAGVPD